MTRQLCANLRLVDVLVKVDASSFASFWHDASEHFLLAVYGVHVLEADILT